MPYIGKQLVRGQNRKLDDISSGFNGSQTTFTLQVASQNVTVGSALQLWISLGGVIQEPTIDYTIAGNQITFTTAPAASLDFFGVIQGDVTDTNTPGDATVTTSKLATGLTVNLTDGSAATSSLQLGGTDSGLFSSAADKVNVTTGGVERLEIGDSEVVFNDPSNDVDFRVESNGNTHMLFVDAGNDRVGIGTTSPSNVLHVNQTDATANSYVHITHADSGSAGTDGLSIGIEDGGVNAVIRNRENGYLRMFTNNTERMRIDSSGKVGIGTSSPATNLHITGSGDTIARVTSADGSGAFLDLGDASDPDGGRIVYDSGSNLAFSTASTERLRIDTSGRVGIGTSSPSAKLDVNGNVQFGDGGGFDMNINGTRHQFSIGGSEKMRIDSSGNVGIGTTSPSDKLEIKGTNGGYSFRVDAESTPVTIRSEDNTGAAFGAIRFTAGNASTEVERMRIDSSGKINIAASGNIQSSVVSVDAANYGVANGFASKVGNNSYFNFVGVSPSNAINFVVYGDGTVENSTGTIGQYSDIKLKENIVDAGSQWDDFKAVRFRKFNFKEETGFETHTQLGVIAQELEVTCPNLVTERKDLDGEMNETGTTTKSVKTSILYMKAIVALQEAMERIETLEAKVAALEAG